MGFENKDLYKEKSVHGDAFFPLKVYKIEYLTIYNILHYHWHEEIEFIYMAKGQYKFLIGSETLVLDAGEVAIVNSSDIHSGFGGDPKDYCFYSIVFSPGMLEGAYNDICDQEYIKPLIHGKYKFPLHIRGGAGWETVVIEEIQKIINDYLLRPKAYPLFIKASLFRIYSELLANGKFLSEPDDSKDKLIQETRFKKIIDYIEQNYHEKISIGELAQQINVCEDYFFQIFKNLTGKTPVHYLNQYRINKAAVLLRDTTLSVQQIADMTGFDTVSYFSRIFKQHKNCSPLKYRKGVLPK